MGDEYCGFLEYFTQPNKFVLQLPADQRVEGRKRLIHQQHIRVGGERTGQSNPLLHPTGQLMGEF